MVRRRGMAALLFAGAPANATAPCNDGTYSMLQHRTGSRSRHKGVKSWLEVLPE